MDFNPTCCVAGIRRTFLQCRCGQLLMKQKKNLTSALTYHRQLLIETAEKIGIYGTAGGVR